MAVAEGVVSILLDQWGICVYFGIAQKAKIIPKSSCCIGVN